MKKKISIAIAVLAVLAVITVGSIFALKDKSVTLGQQLSTVDTENMSDEEKTEQMQKMFEQTDFADSEIEKIEQPHLDKHGCIRKSKVKTVLKQVYSWAKKQYDQGIITYISYDPDNESIVMKFSSGISYMYVPEVYGQLSSGRDIKIATYEPFHNKGFTGDSRNLINNLGNTFDSEDNYKDDNITFEDVKRLDEYQIIVWIGHGGYNKDYHSVLSLPIKYKIVENNGDYFNDINDDRIISLKNGNSAVTSKFFTEYFSTNYNTEIYLGACSSGKDRILADSFLTNGASVVCGYTDSVYKTYENDIRKKLFQYLHRKKQNNEGAYSWSEALKIATSGIMGIDTHNLLLLKLTKPVLFYPIIEAPSPDSGENLNNLEANEPEGFTLIYTAQDLDNIRNNLEGNYILMNDIDLAKWGNWEPIGSDDENPFEGEFDGNGHVIKNMTINIDSEDEVYAGLFGYVRATIRNTGMTGSKITATSSDDVYAGGIAGYSSSSISNCYNTSSVNAISSEEATARYAYVGGIVGHISSGTIDNCYNTGAVSSTSNASFTHTHVGGIAGRHSFAEVSNCYNAGVVTILSTSSDAYAGGILGYGSSSSIKNSHNTGEVKATCYNSHVGGIAGATAGDTISNCYNTAKVIIDAESLRKPYAYVGGITGHSSSELNNCYNIGEVSAKAHSINAGGIAGYKYGSDFEISHCYNVGTVNTKDDVNPWIGGIAGRTDSTISNCYYLNSLSKAATSGSGMDLISRENVTLGSGVLAHVNSLTANQMKIQSSFIGFDFNTIWGIDPSINNGYPYLR